eukprot:1161996-Pelagomonas_calceolata.AAC.3
MQEAPVSPAVLASAGCEVHAASISQICKAPWEALPKCQKQLKLMLLLLLYAWHLTHQRISHHLSPCNNESLRWTPTSVH